ncbi:MAG: hypothetical protein FWG02_04335 [Holophagaceae bacterium]|nr:hypothetical protein [Holophagaceae bacterium]
MKISKKSPILQKLALSAELVLKSPAFGPAALALTGIAVVGIVGCSGGSNTPDKKPDPKPQPTPQQLEEARRLAEFNRLSAPVNENKTIIEVKQMSDFEAGNFGYNAGTHTARGYSFAVSSTVTDQILKARLEKEAERINNFILPYSWEHELRHGKNAKYRHTIKEPQNLWKSAFLDETSAYLSEMILFRKNMLDEYAKQLTEWDLAGKDPNQFKFSSRSYNDAIGNIPDLGRSHMMTWWDANNKFTEFISAVSQEEALQLMSCHYELFSNIFDSNVSLYRDPINSIFGQTNFISCKYDADEWFQTALNAMFTYKIGDKDVNLFELMTPADREAFLSKLNTKMQLEYDRYHSGYYD